MPLPDPIFAYAAVVVMVFSAGVYFRREEMEIGEIIYAIVVAIAIAASILILPYEIPTTGKIVFAPAWSPPKYEYPNPQMEKIFTPEFVEQLRRESPVPLSEEFFHNSVTNTKIARSTYEGLWWAAIDLVCFAGWFIVPQWLEGIVNPPRRRPRSRDERELE